MTRGEAIIAKRHRSDLLKHESFSIGPLPSKMDTKDAFVYYNKKLEEHWRQQLRANIPQSKKDAITKYLNCRNKHQDI